jgi:hypothetical protein
MPRERSHRTVNFERNKVSGKADDLVESKDLYSDLHFVNVSLRSE